MDLEPTFVVEDNRAVPSGRGPARGGTDPTEGEKVRRNIAQPVLGGGFGKRTHDRIGGDGVEDLLDEAAAARQRLRRGLHAAAAGIVQPGHQVGWAGKAYLDGK